MSPIKKLTRKAAKWALGALLDANDYRERQQRPIEQSSFTSVNEDISERDWQDIVSDSRKIYANVGPARAAINDKAIYSIGRAWLPVYEGKDKAWGDAARDWLINKWYPLFDIRGDVFDFQTQLYLLSVSIDRDGDTGVALVDTGDGWPAIQLIPAHMIGERGLGGEIKSGPYKGLVSVKGVVLNGVRPVAYRVLGATENEDTYISARDMMLPFDPEYADQVRGIPGFSHAILDLRDLRMVQGYEKKAAALCSAIGLVETNETGGPDMDDPAIRLRGGGTQGGAHEQSILGGMVKYFRTGTGGSLQTLQSDRPSEGWNRLMDRLIRNAYSGIGWPYELSWDSRELNAGAVRLVVARAMRSVQDRQDLVRPVARRCVGYAIAKAIKRGDLPPNDEWYKWGFTMPARMSVDYGRDSNAVRQDYISGVRNLSDILEENGRTLDAHAAQRKADNEILRASGLQVVGVDGTVIPTNDGRVQPLIASIGIGGTEALTALLAQVGQGQISRDSGRALLVSVFGMNPTDADAAMGSVDCKGK